MSFSTQITPLTSTLPGAIKNIVNSALEGLPKSWPCTVVAVKNNFVTVKFEVINSVTPQTIPQVTIPQAISRYARPPTQVGDKGFAVAADTFLSGVIGLTNGPANISQQPGNLSTLVFVPLSNTGFSSVDNNAYNITGPNGAVIQDDSGNAKITLTPSQIVLSVGGNNVTINSSGVSITGTLTINGKPFLSHEHSGVTAGSGNTGAVVP